MSLENIVIAVSLLLGIVLLVLIIYLISSCLLYTSDAADD